MCFVFELWYNFTTMEWSFFSQTDPLFFHKKTAAPLKNCFTESAVFYFSILFFYLSLFIQNFRYLIYVIQRNVCHPILLPEIWHGCSNRIFWLILITESLYALSFQIFPYLRFVPFFLVAYPISSVCPIFSVAYPKFHYFSFFCGTFSTYVNLLCHIFLL